MHDVARLAGVSHQTVSRYVRGDRTVGEDLAQRIATAVAQLGYRPNLAARAMRTNESGHLALVLPSGRAIGSLVMLAGAREQAQSLGYELDALMIDLVSQHQRQRILGLVEAGIFDGVVSLVELGESPGEVQRPEPRLVVTGDYDSQMRTRGDIASAEPLREIMTRLRAAGHRYVLHLAGDFGHASARNRRDVYLGAVRELGLTDCGVIETRWDSHEALRALAALPADCPVTAVIAAQDALAATAIRACAARGKRVPQDVVVTGWDNHPVGEQMMPSLTTVEPDYAAVGRRAVVRLVNALARADGGPGEARRDMAGAPLDEVAPAARIIWRESTGSA